MKSSEITGYMHENELDWLYNKAKEMDSIIEIGALMGRSTHALLSGCKGMVHVVDHFKGSPEHQNLDQAGNFQEIFMKNCGHFPNLVLYPHAVEDVLEQLPYHPDMVFIDGLHDEDSVKFDLDNVGLRATKLICGHDAAMYGVKKAVTSTFNNADNYEVAAYSIWYREVK